MRRLWRLLVILFAGILGFFLMRAMIDLPPPVVRLPNEVSRQIVHSGVSHPVTAVLLNFRGYDTLLEVAVLLLAVLGVLATDGREAARGSVTTVSAKSNVLQFLSRLLAPLIILMGGYLLWAGAHRPGGAFQAAAVLAGGAVLLHLARVMPAWITPGRWLRVGLLFGFLIFCLVAASALPQGTLLQYPQVWAGALIFLIEAGLTLSLSLILAGLFLFLSEDKALDE